MSERFSLDELLSFQSTATTVATVEAVDDESDSVKVTPWVRGTGCLCHLALKLPKAAIDYVSPTGDVHYCCGKSLRVVEIHFADEGSISLRALFGQIMESAHGQQQQGQHAPHARPLAQGEAARPFALGGGR